MMRVRPRRVAVVLALIVAGAAWLRVGPLPPGLLEDRAAPSTLVVDRHGEVLFEARSALGVRGGRIDRTTLPAPLAMATMAAEDARFRSHVGVDPIAIVRAAWRNLRARRIVEGGSTITQQVAKLLLIRASPSRTRGWLAKVHEAVVALRLEHRFTKDEILAMYLDLAPYGNQIAGAERASDVYFGRAPATLTIAEAAFLAALPQQPTRFNPWRDASAAIARQRRILADLETRGWIDGATRAAAVRERLVLAARPAGAVAPHFVQRVLQDTAAAHPSTIETTIDATLERTVSGIISAHHRDLDDHYAHNVAVAVLDNHTGEWLAWEGSGNYFDRDHGGAIDGVLAPRQPGSALKPFTYAAAFERGYTPASVLADVPSHFPTAELGILYSPRNYDGLYRGPLPARVALAGSENVPAVALAADIGVPAILRLLRRAGFTSLTDNSAQYGLGLTLGNAEVPLGELVAAYAMLARGGESVAPRSVRALDGAPQAVTAGERLISPQTAFWITDILADNDARAYIFGRGGSLEFPFAVAAKTGTSQAYHDNWAVGYTADVTVGVWVGNFDRTPLRDSTGVTGAGPIFHDVMIAAIERVRGSLPIGDDSPIVPMPAGMRRVTLCGASGLAAGDACPTRIDEWLPATSTVGRCTWHHASDEGVITVWPSEYRAWAASAGLLRAETPAVSRVDGSGARPIASPQAAPVALTIANPLQGATYLIDPTLRREFQTLPLRVRGATSDVEWFVDGASVGRSTADHAIDWPLLTGTHRVTVRDDAGRSTVVNITVR